MPWVPRRQTVENKLLPVLLAVWVGGHCLLGYLVVPTLFAFLHDPQLAGAIAGELFQRAGWLEAFCASGVLILLWRAGNKVRWLGLAAMLLALTLLGLLWIQPQIALIKAERWAMPAGNEVLLEALAQRFARWHALASVVYLLQSLGGVVLLAACLRPVTVADEER